MAKARTAKQRAALRKAQLASARKRKGKGKVRGVKPKLSAAAARARRNKIKRNARIAGAIGGVVGYGAAVYAAKKYAARHARDWQAEANAANAEWARRRAHWERAKAQYRNAEPSKPRFVKSTRGPGMPLHPQRALPGPQLALPRGRS